MEPNDILGAQFSLPFSVAMFTMAIAVCRAATGSGITPMSISRIRNCWKARKVSVFVAEDDSEWSSGDKVPASKWRLRMAVSSRKR